MSRYIISLIVLVFLLGWVANNVYSDIYKGDYQLGMVQDKADDVSTNGTAVERPSPADRIKESQIHVYDDSVVIQVNDPEWSTFTDTNSMDPVIDKGANAIHVVPKSPDDLQVGDIVAYHSQYANGTIIHRIIDKGTDDQGTYFILKGDNNTTPDPGKVRFSQIKRVLIAIIY